MRNITHPATLGTLIALIAFQPVLQAASSLPTGGTFTAGSGKISTSGNVLTINQNTLKGIIDWNTFSIGSNSSVNFKNGHGATLNVITGVTPSSIFGKLLATGNVYLINPEGILIGHGATIHTGGDFLATTLSLPNSAFLNGGPLTFTGSSNATVVNLGDLTSTGGSIYLIGHTVQNTGSITTPNGTTALAAGAQVLITDSSGTQKVAVKAPGGDVTNSGFIQAAEVELKSNGGNIYALAGNNGGQINATGTATQDGHVWLIATNGTTNVSGLISATNANGTGGTIETSGANVAAGGATIKTGKGGNWLLDP
jgi:filamentous hemagglutinin family protein